METEQDPLASKPTDVNYQSAAIDITTGHAAQDFLAKNKPIEPWAMRCFITLVDGAVNHETFLFPHPTQTSAIIDPAKVIPLFMNILMKKRLIKPVTNVVASDLDVQIERLDSVLMTFKRFALSNIDQLAQWVNFHNQPKLKDKHITQMPKDVQPFIKDYWSNSEKAREFESELGLPLRDARYAFDVYFRGQQYIEILNGMNSLYLPHPVRSKIFEYEINKRFKKKNNWSWGGVIADLILNNKFSRRGDEVSDLIYQIKEKILKGKTTIYNTINGKEYLDKQAEIAVELKLPAKLGDRIIKALKAISISGAGYLDYRFKTPGLFVLGISLGFIKLNMKERYIPGNIGVIKIIRGEMYWPGSHQKGRTGPA